MKSLSLLQPDKTVRAEREYTTSLTEVRSSFSCASSYKEADLCLLGPNLCAHLIQQGDIAGHQLEQLRNLTLRLQQHVLHEERDGENAIPVGSVKRGVPSLSSDTKHLRQKAEV